MTASELILQKALVGSDLDSSQWNQIQAGLRNRAFFSSRVAEVNILAAMRERVAKYAEGETDLSKIRMEFREELRRANYQPQPGEEGTIHDLFSQARIDVIVKTNVAQARGYIQYAEGMSPGAFAAFPAQEFTRVAHRKNARQDWPQRWAKAGGKTYGGKMIALKDDPVWVNLSVFGNPFPPFDWGSGMGVLDVDRKTAIELGLIDDAALREKTAEMRKKPLPDFNENMQASVPFRGNNDPEWLRFKDAFGDQVVYRDGAVVWKGEVMQGVARGEGSARLGKSTGKLLSHFSGTDREHLENTSLTLTGDWVKQHAGKHIGENEKDPRNIPLTPGDFELIPSLWRDPDSVLRGKYAGSSVLQMETLDGGLLNLVIDHRSGAMPLSFWKTISPRASDLMVSRLRATLPQRTVRIIPQTT